MHHRKQSWLEGKKNARLMNTVELLGICISTVIFRAKVFLIERFGDFRIYEEVDTLERRPLNTECD